jgi:hypothetical protein
MLGSWSGHRFLAISNEVFISLGDVTINSGSGMFDGFIEVYNLAKVKEQKAKDKARSATVTVDVARHKIGHKEKGRIDVRP